MKNLSPKEWKAAYEGEELAMIIDIRSPDQWEKGDISGAVYIDMDHTTTFIKELERYPKSIPYYVFSLMGIRSQTACLIMEDLGFKSTYSLDGGILRWNK